MKCDCCDLEGTAVNGLCMISRKTISQAASEKQIYLDKMSRRNAARRLREGRAAAPGRDGGCAKGEGNHAESVCNEMVL